MHNDIRDDESVSPRIRRSAGAITVGIVALLVAVVGLLAAVADLIPRLSDLAKGVAWASVPLNPDSVAEATSSWSDSLEAIPSGTSYADVMLRGLSDATISQFQAVAWLDFVVAIVASILVAGAAITLLIGRLRWSMLGWVSMALGALIVIGALVGQPMAQNANQSASLEAYADAEYWAEPGFLSGIDFVPLVTGLLIVALALGILKISRFATAADGVV